MKPKDEKEEETFFSNIGFFSEPKLHLITSVLMPCRTANNNTAFSDLCQNSKKWFKLFFLPFIFFREDRPRRLKGRDAEKKK